MSVFDRSPPPRREALSLLASLALGPNSPRRGLAHGAFEAPERRTRAKEKVKCE